MEDIIYKIGKLIIENEGYTLEISPTESEIQTELKISSILSEWINNAELSIETKPNDIYKRKGIWFEQGISQFFSKVSLFEETEYYFKIYRSISKDLDKQNQGPQKLIPDIEDDIKGLLFSFFFESIGKWVSEIKNQNRKGFDKSSIIIKEVNKNWLWSINFKSYTGRLKLKKEIIGNDANDIEIIPRKLRKQDYIQILDGLNLFISQVFFKNKSPTQIPATKEYLPSEIIKTKLYDCATYLLIKSIMKEIHIYFYGIINRLNSKFYYFDNLINIHEIRDVSNIDYIKTISNTSNLLLLTTTHSDNIAHFYIDGDIYTFNKIHSYSKELSFDTLENRFIKFVLRLLFNELEREDIKKYFSEVEKYDEKSELTDYFTDITEKLHFLERKDIQDLEIIPYNSQTLQKNSYYRRFLQYFIWLQNPTAFNIDNLFIIDIKPMWLLYEYYCLNIMKKSLDLLAKSEDGLLEFPDNMDDHILYTLDDRISEYRAIKYIQIKYKNRNGEIIQLIYKPMGLKLKNTENKEVLNSYSTLTRQDPDFLLVKMKDDNVCIYGGKNHMIVIDSKYRVESGELWAKMHFYKDALNAIGTIFINPSVDEKDLEDSGKLLTPYGEISEDKTVYKTAIEYGFVTCVNVLGLIKTSDPVSGFMKLFKIILEKYFQSSNLE